MRQPMMFFALSWLTAIAHAIPPHDLSHMTSQGIGPNPVNADDRREANRSLPPGFTITHHDGHEETLSTHENGIAGRILNKRDGHICGPVCLLSRVPTPESWT